MCFGIFLIGSVIGRLIVLNLYFGCGFSDLGFCLCVGFEVICGVGINLK